MKPLRMAFLTALCLLPGSMASAHEPLWGESPQTFAFGIWHPEIRFGFEDDDLLLMGSNRLSNLDSLRRSRFDTLLGVQYAPKTALNVRIDMPVSQVWTRQRIGGQLRTSSGGGLGDILISAKSRFYLKAGEDWKVHQSYSIGLQLPTGRHNVRYPNGELLSPSDQPGSGKFGYMLGYAFAYERLQDTVWASVLYNADIGGTGSKGAMLQIDANYGYWVKRAKRPQDLGIILAAGPHYELMGPDRSGSNQDNDNGYAMAGLEASAIVTKGEIQFRIGAMVPVYEHVSGTQLRPNVEVRAGLEALF